MLPKPMMKTICFVLGSILIVSLAIYFLSVPPISVKSESEHVLVDVKTFGEYYSHLSAIELSKCSTTIPIWRIEAAPDSSYPQITIWTFALRVGENSSDVGINKGQSFPEQFKIVLPKTSSFNLEKNICYRITAFPLGWGHRFFKNSVTFMLSGEA